MVHPRPMILYAVLIFPVLKMTVLVKGIFVVALILEYDHIFRWITKNWISDEVKYIE